MRYGIDPQTPSDNMPKRALSDHSSCRVALLAQPFRLGELQTFTIRMRSRKWTKLWCSPANCIHKYMINAGCGPGLVN